MSTVTQELPTEEAETSTTLKIPFWLFLLGLGIIAFIILTNVVRFPTPHLVYTFSGKVTTVDQKQVCIQPNNGEWSYVAQALFQKEGAVCGEVTLAHFQPVEENVISNILPQFTFTQPVLLGENVRAGLTWQTNANGDWVKTYLVIR